MEIRRSLSAVSLTALLFRNELGALNGGQLYCNMLRNDQTLEHIPARTSLKSPRMCVRQLCLNSFCKRRTASYRTFVFPSWAHAVATYDPSHKRGLNLRAKVNFFFTKPLFLPFM
jgi:hypothetical protein